MIQRIIEEEMVNLIHDDPESTRGELKLLGGLKKMIEEKKGERGDPSDQDRLPV